MSVELGAYRDQVAVELLSAGSPLTAEAVAKFYPYVFRQVPDKRLVHEPQSGEYYRYGVFFWALKDPGFIQSLPSRANGFPLLMRTEDLFQACEMDTGVLSRGIVVDPSPYFSRLYQDISDRCILENPNQDPSSIKFGFDVERQIMKSHAVLNCGAVKAGSGLPMLSVPSVIKIEESILIPV